MMQCTDSLPQQVYYAAFHVLTPSASPEGYHWLCMLSTYLQIDGLLGLDVHTDETLSTINQEILVFGNALQVSHHQLIMVLSHANHSICSRTISKLASIATSKTSRLTGISQRSTFGNMSYGMFGWKGLLIIIVPIQMKICTALSKLHMLIEQMASILWNRFIFYSIYYVGVEF